MKTLNEEELGSLGRRAVACKGWRWMPGMLPSQLTERYQNYPRLGEDPERIAAFYDSGITPDFSDPATLGCLLALVRETTKASELTTYCDSYREDGMWLVIDYIDESGAITSLTEAKNEAAALVAALELANEN